jgi:tRNA-2-methylthio-N6-dimethylallyladenosine synthase
VSEAEKQRRLNQVMALQEESSIARYSAAIGHEFPVLVEGPARRGVGMLAGKTPQYKTAIFPARNELPERNELAVPDTIPVATGDTVNVRVLSATSHTLTCVLSGPK